MLLGSKQGGTTTNKGVGTQNFSHLVNRLRMVFGIVLQKKMIENKWETSHALNQVFMKRGGVPHKDKNEKFVLQKHENRQNTPFHFFICLF
jgi:hypothetical protein